MIRAEAQAVLDGFAAAGLLAYVCALAIRRGGGLLTPRLIFLFGLMSVFYGLRSLMVWTGAADLQTWVFATAAVTPFAVLVLGEGLLRRHAPRPLKIAIGTACLLSVGFALFTRSHLVFGTRFGLATLILLSLLAVLILLAARDRSALSPAENRAVGRLVLGLLVSIPLIVTDFRELTISPIGFSPIAVLLIVLLALSSGVSDARDVWIEIGLILLAGAALAFGLAQGLDIDASADRIRLFALVTAGLITAALLVRIQPFGAARRRNDLRLRLGTADTRSLGAFLSDVADEPMLQGMVVLEEGDLSGYQPQVLADALARQPLWSKADLTSTEAEMPDAEREPLLELLERATATHVGLLSRSPVRVGLVRLPDLLNNSEAEIDLGLTFRMARLSAEATR